MSARGVKNVLNAACLQMVMTFMDCYVTMRCRASLGRAVYIAFAPCLGCVHVGCFGLSGATRVMGSIMCGAGITPGVLFQVTH
jgi:hypothetical protein